MIVALKSFSPAEAGPVIRALEDSPYGELQDTRIHEAIDKKINLSRQGNASDAQVSTKQFLKSWWNYFTAVQWELLLNPRTSWNMKMTTLVERGHSVGCAEPDEQALKWALATLLLVHYDDMPVPRQVYQKLQDLKQSYASERKPYMHELLTLFPEFPKDLPAHIYKDAYPDDEPVIRELQGVHTVADAVPLRSNSKILKNKNGEINPQTFVLAKVKKEPKVEDASAPSAQVDADLEEEALLKEYKQKLTEYRRKKSQGHIDSQESVPTGTLAITRSSDGTLKTESTTDAPTTAVKTEEPTTAERKTAPTTDVKTEPGPVGVDALDPYTQAAINSLSTRENKRKQDQVEKRKAKRQKETLLKRPAACEKSMKSVKLEPGPSKTAMKDAKAQQELVPKSKIMSAMPKMPADGSNPPPVLYKDGVIYTSQKDRKFRALKNRGDRYSERSKTWVSKKPTKANWVFAVKHIES